MPYVAALAATAAIEAVLSPIEPQQRMVLGCDLLTPNEPERSTMAEIIVAVSEISLFRPPPTGIYQLNLIVLYMISILRNCYFYFNSPTICKRQRGS